MLSAIDVKFWPFPRSKTSNWSVQGRSSAWPCFAFSIPIYVYRASAILHHRFRSPYSNFENASLEIAWIWIRFWVGFSGWRTSAGRAWIFRFRFAEDDNTDSPQRLIGHQSARSEKFCLSANWHILRVAFFLPRPPAIQLRRFSLLRWFNFGRLFRAVSAPVFVC